MVEILEDHVVVGTGCETRCKMIKNIGPKIAEPIAINSRERLSLGPTDQRLYLSVFANLFVDAQLGSTLFDDPPPSSTVSPVTI